MDGGQWEDNHTIDHETTNTLSAISSQLWAMEKGQLTMENAQWRVDNELVT
ncbi:MAG: hypothetical protein KF746_21890 [Chitinophagaceae bacterium]|nr:hypothetical protein [Chitinophagaceae bacterium]